MTRVRHPYLDHPSPLPFAHRGGTANGLENTAAAFRRAAAAGYRYFETDVHTTADGVLVAFHDATLDRVTDASGRIRDLPWAAVGEARVAGKEPLPLFADLLDEFPEARWNVDLKTESALLPLLNLIRGKRAWDRVCVSSFTEARLARAQRMAGPELATSYGVGGVIGLRLRSSASRPRYGPGRSPRRSPSVRAASPWWTAASYGRRTRAGSRSMCGR